MGSDQRLETLKALELALHDPLVRSSAQRLGAWLHTDFHELGRSGARYTRAQIIDGIAGTAVQHQPSIWSQDFELALLAEGVALLTYRSAHEDDGGALTRHTHRSSLWLMTPEGRRLRFHQGTPAPAFEKNSPPPYSASARISA